MKQKNRAAQRKEASQVCTGQTSRAVALMTGKEKRTGWLVQLQGGWATRGGRERERKVGRREGRPTSAVTSPDVFG